MAASRKESLEDDYWGSSKAQKIGRGTNLFDDEVSVDDARQRLKKVDFGDDDDDCDTITWSGAPAVPMNTRLDITTNSARYKPSTPPSSLSKVTGGSSMQVPYQPTGVSRPNFSSNTSHTAGSSQFYTDPSISDVIGGTKTTPPKGQPTHSEIAKLEAQVNFLKRELHGSKKDRFALIPPRDMVRRMIIGEPYSLEAYKSKESKLQFLDEAIKLHDGNVITAAVLYLKNSIKHSIFQRELLARPIATEHYIHYLKQHYELEKLLDLLAYLGRSEEAAMIKYRQSLSSNPETKIRSLQTCRTTHFISDPQLNHDALLIQDYVSLLERQLPVEQDDAREAQKGATKFRENPRKATIVDQPVITTLYYCCFYHYQLPENGFLASPKAIQNAHRLTDKQYVWTAVAARSKLHQWRDLEPLFQTKGWLGGTKMKPIVPFERLVTLLHKLGAPREVMTKFCNLISDNHRRLDVAQKLGCHNSIIETYFNMKDRQAIVAYQHKLKHNSQEWYFASDMLRNSSVKWKN